jgi:hypothetical protein
MPPAAHRAAESARPLARALGASAWKQAAAPERRLAAVPLSVLEREPERVAVRVLPQARERAPALASARPLVQQQARALVLQPVLPQQARVS